MGALLAKFLASKFSGWLAVALLLGICGWGLYAGLIRPVIKPNPSTSNKAETIYQYTYNCKALIGWGCGSCKQVPVAVK
jgi:hypothetical protein